MATGHIGVKEATAPDKYIASNSITEDAKTKELQRLILNDSAGVEQNALGIKTGAAVITDADGTIQQYLRGLIKLFITAGSAFVSSLVAPNANEVHGTSGAITGTTATQVIPAQGASQKIYVTSLLVTNSHATVGTLVTIQDDAGTPVVLWAGYAAPVGGGFALTFPTPLPTTANQKLMAICGTTGANVYVSANGFKGT